MGQPGTDWRQRLPSRGADRNAAEHTPYSHRPPGRRNGGESPLVVERPEVPVLSGSRMLGVATPLDPRDRDRVTIPAGRSQAILLSVPVDDTEFWDAMTQGSQQIRYEPLLGAMRAHFASDAGTDLLTLLRETPIRCVPAAIRLPDGAAVEQSVARVAANGLPTTARAAIAAWNSAWRRQRPEAGGDLIRVDDRGQVVSAAGRTSSALGSGWQIVVDGVPIPLGAPTDVQVTASLELRWTKLEPLFRQIALDADVDEAKTRELGAWATAGLTAWKERRKLMQGVPGDEVASSIETLLQSGFCKDAPEFRGALLTTLGDARRLRGEIQQARASWEQAAKYGDPQAIFSLANQLLDVPESLQQGVTRLRQAASAGSADAMLRLAEVEMLPGGDASKGTLWIGQAAESGHPQALTALAQRFESGAGLPRDVAQAASLYRDAARRGDCAAMLRLGMLYQTGQGVPRDAARASAWYRAAATGVPFEEEAR